MPRLRWIIFFAASSLAALILGTIFWFELQRVLSFHVLINERAVQLDEKRENVGRLRDQIAYYRTREGMARLGREQYNFIFEGEKIFIIETSKDKK